MHSWIKHIFNGRNRTAPADEKSPPVPLRVELLEDRTVLSQTGIPLDVYTIHGTYFNQQNILGSAFGSGRDTGQEEMSEVASAAAKAVHAINPKSTITNVVWASLGDRSTPAHGIAEDLKSKLAARSGAHDVAVISFSAGAYVADKFIKDISQLGNVRRVLAIYLDPTGNRLLGDGTISPLSNKKVSDITYHDNKNPFGSFFATPEFAMPGVYQYVDPKPGASGLSSHNAFPHWYANTNQVVRDLLGYEQATPAETGRANAGANVSFATYSAPGHGENLLIPLVERALQQGFNKIADAIGHEIQVVVDKPGHLLIAAVDVNGKVIGSIYDGAGKLVKDVSGALQHFGHEIDDFFHHLF